MISSVGSTQQGERAMVYLSGIWFLSIYVLLSTFYSSNLNTDLPQNCCRHQKSPGTLSARGK